MKYSPLFLAISMATPITAFANGSPLEVIEVTGSYFNDYKVDEAKGAMRTDVSIQAQVLQLLMKLRKERNLTYLFITHDLSVTEYLCDRIAVMYLGRIVELCKSEDLYKNTLHPYSEALISAIPVADLDKKTKRIVLEGDVPSPVNPPSGCPFHPRCPKAQDICKTNVPELRKYTTEGNEHYASCHLINLPERL